MNAFDSIVFQGAPDGGAERVAVPLAQPRMAALPATLKEAALEVARIVRGHGGRALMVGGAVRDLLLGTSPKDVDIEVFGVAADALVAALGERFRLDLVGMSFGVLKLHGVDIDVALPRRESKRGTGHKGFEIDSDPSLGVAEAATRRDFTLNAMYFDPLTEETLDPHGGRDDLAARRLRHVSPKFSEDPLRVLRGMQFVARFDLDAAPETVALCRGIEPEALPPERQLEEWRKLLTKGVAIRKGLEFLRATGWVRHYPELASLIGCEQDPKWHPEGDVWEHTCNCLDAFARERVGDEAEDFIVGLAVLCHDFGKPATTWHVDGHVRSRGHDQAGVAPTEAFLRRLTNEERLLREVPPLVLAHMQPHSLWAGGAGDSAVRRLARRVGRIDRLLRVASADVKGSGCDLSETTEKALSWLAETAERLHVASAAPEPILLGRHLIALGYRPSRQFGPWLDACYDAQLDGAFSDLEGALRHFHEHVEPQS